MDPQLTNLMPGRVWRTTCHCDGEPCASEQEGTTDGQALRTCLARTLYNLRAMRLAREFRSGVIAKVRIKLHQCVRGILQICGRKILTMTSHFSATHFERLWITHVTWMQDF